MTFNIEAEPIFTQIVEVTPPGGEAQTFPAHFRALPISEYSAYDIETAEGTRALLDAVLLRADDIVGNDGHLLPWTDALKARLLDLTWVRAGIYRAYLEGVGNATRKN